LPEGYGRHGATAGWPLRAGDFIYALIFMASQGISSATSRKLVLFWLPLGIALSGSLKAKR
jgi:hypothetical protein